MPESALSVSSTSAAVVKVRPVLGLAFPKRSSKRTLTYLKKAKRVGMPVKIIPELDNQPPFRHNNDDYVYAVSTDGSLMKASMKRVLSRYEHAIKRLGTL